MAKQYEIQYIRLYTEGSAARQIAPALPEFHQKPRAKRRKRILIHVDPVAILGVMVAAVMLVSMTIGAFQLKAARDETARMEEYVARLSSENITLQHTYSDGYDLETVEKTALSLGMVKAEDATHITLHLPEQETPADDSGFMDQVVAFLTDIFA